MLSPSSLAMMEKEGTIPEQLDQKQSEDESKIASNDDSSHHAIVHNSTEDPYISHFLTKFKPTKILGRGSYGCVFEADEISTSMQKFKVAVKRIPIGGSYKDIQEACQYFSMKRLIHHPGIVKYYDAWFEKPPNGWQRSADEELLHKLLNDGGPRYPDHWPIRSRFAYKEDSAFFYVRMELCSYNLAEWLSSGWSGPEYHMRIWFKQIVSAVAYLHEHGKIHRDLKPSNILFADPNHLKICDLGNMSDRVMTNEDGGQELAMERTFAIGTALYMAPEQMGYAEYTSKVDVFAMGLILAELHVFMEIEQKKTVFDNYRMGRPNTILDKFPKVNEVVTWLTNVNDTDRPDCKTILEHSYLADIDPARRF